MTDLLYILQKNHVIMPFVADEVFHIRLSPTTTTTSASSNDQHFTSNSLPFLSSSSSSANSTPNALSASASLSSSSSSCLSSFSVNKQNTHELDSSTLNEPEAFIFSNGTFVTWNATEAQNDAVLRILKDVEINSYLQMETEWFDYIIDNSQYEK